MAKHAKGEFVYTDKWGKETEIYATEQTLALCESEWIKQWTLSVFRPSSEQE